MTVIQSLDFLRKIKFECQEQDHRLGNGEAKMKTSQSSETNLYKVKKSWKDCAVRGQFKLST